MSTQLQRSARRRDVAFQFQPRYRVAWIAMIALLILCALSASDVYKGASVDFITASAGILAIAAAGQLLVIMSGGIDLSVPAVITLSGAIIVKQTQGADGQMAVAVIEALAAAAMIGLINGVLITYARLNAMIVTLAMNGVVIGATILWAGTSYSTSGNAPASLVKFTQHDVGRVNLLGIIGFVALALIGLGLRSTGTGRSYVAMGTNRVAAEIIGIRIRYYQVAGYVVAAMLYMVAGILVVGMVQNPNGTIGDPYQLSTIVAVALGGASLAGGPGSMLGTALGCLFVTTLNQYLAIKNFNAGVQVLANGVVLVLAVAMVTVGTGGRMRAKAVGARLAAIVGR